MKLKKLKPVTNGTRHQVNLQKNLLSKANRLIKKAMSGTKSMSGRSSDTGRITVWHKGGSCKKLYRDIEFSSRNFNGLVLFNTYDPKRNSFVSLNFLLIAVSINLVILSFDELLKITFLI
jgi:large subunit ribosomal protein L2